MRKRKGGYPSVQRHISCIRSLFTSFPSSIYILNSGKLGRAGSPWMVQKKKRKSFISSSAELCYTMPGNHLCFFFPQFQCATGFIIYVHMYMYIGRGLSACSSCWLLILSLSDSIDGFCERRRRESTDVLSAALGETLYSKDSFLFDNNKSPT